MGPLASTACRHSLACADLEDAPPPRPRPPSSPLLAAASPLRTPGGSFPTLPPTKVMFPRRSIDLTASPGRHDTASLSLPALSLASPDPSSLAVFPPPRQPFPKPVDLSIRHDVTIEGGNEEEASELKPLLDAQPLLDGDSRAKSTEIDGNLLDLLDPIHGNSETVALSPTFVSHIASLAPSPQHQLHRASDADHQVASAHVLFEDADTEDGASE